MESVGSRPQPSSEELIDWDRSIVWHAFSQMAEYDGLIIESADGCTLKDIFGKTYLDGASSLWCNLFGHRVPEIDQAIQDQLRNVAHVTNLGMSHPATITLAKRLIDLAPSNLRHVFFAGDGASAVEVAMKLAFQYWRQCEHPDPRRTKFLALGDAYHGDTIGTVSISGVSRFQSLFSPLLCDVIRGPCPDTYRTPEMMDVEQANAYYLDCYSRLLRDHGHEIVAVVVEPRVQGAAGFIVQPAGFLEGIAALCKEHGVLLIADEIAVGMGRTGKMFAIEHSPPNQPPIQPDLMCIGKGLTGGYLPMSATLASTRIWNAFLGTHSESKTFFHGHTYGGNPLSAAAAHAVLDLFQTRFPLERVRQRSEYLAALLEPLRNLPHVGDVRQAGMMAAVELVRNPATREPFLWEERVAAKVCEALLRRNVWLRPLGNVIPIIPPLSISATELEHLVASLQAELESLQMP
ncbi:MAG: adenosylmethionine--8-amino-7-oxononanoate transaminase [Planctomycetota bacterium]|jgi:adenosylmethionine-8-amino-7-oxononanoate aminotransferase